MPTKDKMSMKEGMYCGGMCHRCHGWTWTLAGAILVANALWPFLEWGLLVGLLVLVKGLSKLAMPSCPHSK